MELQRATILDFVKYRNDDDYRRLIHENPHVKDFIDEETLITLSTIYDHKDELSLTQEQFEKVLAIFGEKVLNKFREESETHETIREMFHQLTPEEVARAQKGLLARLRKEIEHQEQNTPHASAQSSSFPTKRDIK